MPATIEVRATAIKPAFDYGDISHEERSWFESAAIEIEARHNSVWENTIAIGQILTEAKQRIQHGKFSAWVEAKFPWGNRMAQYYMAIAQELGEANTNCGSYLGGIGVKGLAAIASAVSGQNEVDKQQTLATIAEANQAKLEFQGESLTLAEVKKRLEIQQRDIGQLKTQTQMAETAIRQERANAQQSAALLQSHKESEAKRIEAAQQAAYQDTLKGVEQEMSALEAKVLAKDREIKELRLNPDPKMQQAIAQMEQDRRLLQRDIDGLKSQRTQLKQRVHTEEENQQLINLAKVFRKDAGEFYTAFSLLGLENLPDEAIADVREAVARIKLLATHIEENLGEGQIPVEDEEE